MSDDAVSREDQAVIEQLAQGAMQQIAAGRAAEEVSRDLQAAGLAKATADALVEHLQERWREIAAAPQANAELYFRTKYPEMRPVRSAPWLFTAHGIGAGFYNERDHDPATGTYVKTQCLCIFFLPILALGAYRVYPRGSGWTLIGKVPLSRFAKWWNILFLLGVAAVIGICIWDAEAHSPSALAAQKLARADEAAAAGKLLEASRLYGEVARGNTEHAATARQRCAKLVERPEIDGMPLREATEIFNAALQWPMPPDQSQGVLKRGLAMVKEHARTDPAAAAALLRRLSTLSSTEACKAFAELLAGPLAALPPADTTAVFREVKEMPQDDADKTAFMALGSKQCQRLAATDLPAAFELLGVLAENGDRDAVERCLSQLLDAPLRKAPCGAVAKALGVAKAFVEPTGEKKLFDAGLAWVSGHPQADPKELLALLEQLAGLETADEARVAAVRRPLLEKLVAANPQDVDLTVQLALALEAEGSKPGRGRAGRDSAARIVALLTPLRGKLGTGEGARMLGQALAAQGKYDESYVLLGPYLEQRLDAFHEAERAYQDAVKQVETRCLNELRSGAAPGFDFVRAHRASEKERQEMMTEFFTRQLREDAQVNSAREALARQGKVVPAALDLGMVTLQRAQAMKDPAARRTELERAEKTFLAIRGTAGEADLYMLHLGQVYYWLGKEKEGQEQFDKLLAKHERRPETLYQVAAVLRELGASTEARTLLEEAYGSAADARIREAAAHLRAITSKDLDDEILWLQRCNADDYHVQACLAESRGRKAELQGNDEEAAEHFREAVAIYEKQAQTVDVLNNGALASLQLFEISGDRQALDRATQWLEKAVNLSPSDAVVLSNAANEMLRAAAQDLAGARLNLRELQMSGRLGALLYLAGDQQQLDELRRRASEHSGIRKCLNYLERASVLAPKNRGNQVLAQEVYGFLRDRAALARLAARIAAAKPDLQEERDHLLKYYQFKDETSAKDAMRSQLARYEALAGRLGSAARGPAFAAAADCLVALKMTASDNTADADEQLRMAEEAHRAAPSLATYGALIDALMYRATRTLAADFPAYANATRGTARAAPADLAVALALERNDALGKAARDNRDVQRAIALAAERVRSFPEMRGYWAWSVLAAAQPPQGELRAKCLTPDELDELQTEIGRMLHPINPHEAFEDYWKRRAAGDAKARDAFDTLVKLGIPLPVGLIEK